MKKTLHLVHKFIALGAGAFIVPICVAGALLAFREPLTPIVNPALMVQADSSVTGRYARVLAGAIAVAQPDQSIEIRLHASPNRAAYVELHGGAARTLHVNPYSGVIVADSASDWLPFDVLFRLHRTLLAGELGEYLVAGVGAALAIMCLTGLLLWWPRQWRQALRIRWQGNRMAVSFDLHKAVGASIAVFLLFNALTGLVLIFSDATTTIVNRAAGIPASLPPATQDCAAPAQAKNLDELVRAAEQAFSAGVVTQVMYRGTSRAVVVRKRTGAEHNPLGSNRIYMDPCTGVVIKVDTLEQLPPGNAMYEWLYPLHSGAMFGSAHRALLVTVGLGSLIMLVTGLLLWRARSRAKQRSTLRTNRA